jgi:chaperonin cofactor prefoldin
MAKPEMVDVDAVRHDNSTYPKSQDAASRLVEKVLGTSMADKVDAARQKVREQFQARVSQAQTRWTEQLGELEKKAQSVVQQVQATAHEVVEKKNDAVQKVEQVAHDVTTKIPSGGALMGQVEHLMKLPVEAREDMLTNLGVASQKQVAQLHEEIAALAAEIKAHFHVQTEVLGQALEGKHGHADHADHAPTLRLHTNKGTRRKKGDTAEA